MNQFNIGDFFSTKWNPNAIFEVKDILFDGAILRGQCIDAKHDYTINWIGIENVVKVSELKAFQAEIRAQLKVTSKNIPTAFPSIPLKAAIVEPVSTPPLDYAISDLNKDAFDTTNTVVVLLPK